MHANVGLCLPDQIPSWYRDLHSWYIPASPQAVFLFKQGNVLPISFFAYAHFATAALRTCVLKKPPFVRSMTCWYTDWGGWFMTTVPAW